MVHDLSQDTSQPAAAGKDGMVRQAVAGLMPPQLGEAMIRETWPSVVAISSGMSALGARLIRTVFLAPLGWMVLAPLFGRRLMPGLARRYTLTNQRLMIRHGLKPTPGQAIALADIDDVRVVPESHDSFFRCGTLEILSGGQVKMTLPGVPEPEGFRHAILNAVKAWVPEKAKGPFLPASAVKG